MLFLKDVLELLTATGKNTSCFVKRPYRVDLTLPIRNGAEISLRHRHSIHLELLDSMNLNRRNHEGAFCVKIDSVIGRPCVAAFNEQTVV